MLSKLQKLREEREQGFTLIELLVVILIIGILAAIAIPAFLNQRKSAVDSTAQSDAKNVATAVETAAVKAKGQAYNVSSAVKDATSNTYTVTLKSGTTQGSGTDIATADVVMSAGNDLTVTGPNTGWTVTVKNANGDAAASTNGVVYSSSAGGLK